RVRRSAVADGSHAVPLADRRTSHHARVARNRCRRAGRPARGARRKAPRAPGLRCAVSSGICDDAARQSAPQELSGARSVTVGRALAALLMWGGLARAQVPVVRIVDPGIGQGPQLLARELTAPYALIPPGPGRAVLPRDSAYRTTVVVIGREAAL